MIIFRNYFTFDKNGKLLKKSYTYKTALKYLPQFGQIVENRVYDDNTEFNIYYNDYNQITRCEVMEKGLFKEIPLKNNYRWSK